MKLITDLRQTSSRLQKEQLLKYANELEQKVLHYAYNPHLRFGIANIPAGDNLGEPNEELFIFLDLLADGYLTGDLARSSVAEHAKLFGDLIYLICRKDLDCGVSAKTINKVFPKLVPVFNVQLAKEVPLAKLTYPLLAQIKYDGVRVIARVKASQNKCELFTRNGKLINCPSISDTLLANIDADIVLDGELTTADGKMTGRTSISGRVNSALHGGILSVYDLVFTVFDYIPSNAFDEGECIYPYSFRFEQASNYVTGLNCKYIKLANWREVHSAEDANDYYTKVLAEGYEGVILKSREHKYTFKRSKDWVKVKAIKSADLTCDVAVPGKPGTKYEKDIGALECYGEVEGKQVKVSVGSGLSDAERQYNINYFDGKTIEIKYNGVIRNAEDNGWTLFLPRFISVRFDK